MPATCIRGRSRRTDTASWRGTTYDAVVVISPSHTEYFSYASVFPGAAYRTPLGDIPVDVELAKLIVVEERSREIRR